MIRKFGKSKLVQVARRPEEILTGVQISNELLHRRLAKRLTAFDSVKLDPDRFLYIRNRAISAEESWGPNCLFQKDALIFTDDGPKKIKDVVVGDKVLSHRGVFRKVTRLIRREASEKISMRLMHRGRKSILQFTPEHPVLVNGNWVLAKDLSVGDEVQVLGSKCETCGKVIASGWRFCSRTCTSTWKMQDPATRKRIIAGLRKVGKSKEFKEKVGKSSKRAWAKTPQRRKEQSKLFRGLLNSGTLHAWHKDEVKNKQAAKKRSGTMKVLCNSPEMSDWREAQGNRLRILNKDPEFQEKRRRGILRASEVGFTNIETALMGGLEERGISFVPQFKIDTGKRICIIDIAFPDVKLAVECDGDYWHTKEGAADRDREREDHLREVGWDVIRFWGTEILDDVDKCSDKVQRVLMNHSGEYEFLKAKIAKIDRYFYKTQLPVFNLEVEEDNSFLVASPTIKPNQVMWVAVHNCNYDAWQSAELQAGHETFINSMLDVDHDPSLLIGMVLDSVMLPKAVVPVQTSKDAAIELKAFLGYGDLKDGDQLVGDWVENVWAIERIAMDSIYPNACEAILDGEITDTSMGCSILYSTCSICGNKATDDNEYCKHIGTWGVNKGTMWKHPITGHMVPSYEQCFGVTFFEDSLIMPEAWNQYPGSQGADVSAKILQIIASKHGGDDQMVRHFAGQLRLLYHRIPEDKRGSFVEILESIE